jgi:quinol monooxygenase YgiN
MDQPQEEFIEAQSSHPKGDTSEPSARPMVHVIAIVTTKPGQREEVLKFFAENRPNVLAENGCIEYQAAVDSEPTLEKQTTFGPDAFAVIEKWESIEALQAHFKAPHMAAYAAKTRDMIASRVIHVLEPV